MLRLRCSDLERFVVGRNYRSNHGFGRRGNREERQEDDTKKKDTASLQMMHAKIELLSRQEQEICKLLKLTPRDNENEHAICVRWQPPVDTGGSPITGCASLSLLCTSDHFR